jgi:hypothetical protein
MIGFGEILKRLVLVDYGWAGDYKMGMGRFM